MSDLPPTVLYELAAPSTPDEVVDAVTEKAENGRRVGDDIKEVEGARTEGILASALRCQSN